jgi:hypothetical protein
MIEHPWSGCHNMHRRTGSVESYGSTIARPCMNGCPGLPKEWVRGLERHPEPLGLAGDGYPLPGWCWLDTPLKVMSVAEHLLEFREDPPSP